MDAKKVIVLDGSPHAGGATQRAARIFLDQLDALGGVDTELVRLADYDIGMCRGCKLCFDQGEDRCPLKDDRDVLLGKIDDADGVVLASPNYAWQVSGLMKNFLDRTAFALHRPPFHGKTASAIVVYGIGLGGRVRKYLQFVEGGLGFTVVKGSASRTLAPMTQKAIRRMDEALAEQAVRFHRQLMKPAFPNPGLFKLIMFRMGRTGIRLNSPRDKRDWAFYRDKGWFESDYYYPVHLGFAKRAIGAFFDWFTEKAGLFSVETDEQGGDGGSVVAQ